MPESCRKSKPAATVAERVGKHRLENKLKTELSMMKQQMKRSQLLASGTPEAERMRKEAAERKRRQRMREKEEKDEPNVVRRMSADRGMEMPGNPHNLLIIIIVMVIHLVATIILIILLPSSRCHYHHHDHQEAHCHHSQMVGA